MDEKFLLEIAKMFEVANKAMNDTFKGIHKIMQDDIKALNKAHQVLGNDKNPNALFKDKRGFSNIEVPWREVIKFPNDKNNENLRPDK